MIKEMPRITDSYRALNERLDNANKQYARAIEKAAAINHDCNARQNFAEEAIHWGRQCEILELAIQYKKEQENDANCK